MLMFHFHLVFLSVLAIFAAGMVLLHFAASAGSRLLRIAGIVLVAGSLASAACLIFYGVRYWQQGAYAVAHGGMHHPMMKCMMQDGMGKGGMMDGGRGDGGMMMGPGGRRDMAPGGESSPEEHEQHHPERSMRRDGNP